MKIHDVPNDGAVSSSGMKRKSGYLGGFDTQQYGRGKRAREVGFTIVMFFDIIDLLTTHPLFLALFFMLVGSSKNTRACEIVTSPMSIP